MEAWEDCLTFSGCKYWNQITATPSLCLFVFAFCFRFLIWVTLFVAYTQIHGFILLWRLPHVDVFFKNLLKFDEEMVKVFPAQIFCYIQALYKYNVMCTYTFNMSVRCFSAISFNVYMCMKKSRYISRGHLISYTQVALENKPAAVTLSSAWFCLRGIFNKWRLCYVLTYTAFVDIKAVWFKCICLLAALVIGL